jgi:hypothetical protein
MGHRQPRLKDGMFRQRSDPMMTGEIGFPRKCTAGSGAWPRVARPAGPGGAGQPGRGAEPAERRESAERRAAGRKKLRYAELTEQAPSQAGRADAARETEAATAARYVGRDSYCSLLASSTSGQPHAVARAVRACMTNGTPSHKRLTLASLSSWTLPKSASMEDQWLRNSRRTERRPVASRREPPVEPRRSRNRRIGRRRRVRDRV